MLPNAFNLPEDNDRDFRPVAAALAKGFNTLRTFPDQQLNADLQNVDALLVSGYANMRMSHKQPHVWQAQDLQKPFVEL